MTVKKEGRNVKLIRSLGAEGGIEYVKAKSRTRFLAALRKAVNREEERCYMVE